MATLPPSTLLMFPSIAAGRARSRRRATTIVEFTDSDDVAWRVFEVVQHDGRRGRVSPTLADGWLCFERADGRRVRLGRWSYPRNWWELTTAELEWLLSIGRIARSDAETSRVAASDRFR